MPSLKDFIDALTTSWRPALAALIATAAVLAADYYDLKYLSGLPSWVLPVAFLVFVLAIAILASHIIAKLAEMMSKRRADKSKQDSLRAHASKIHGLPYKDMFILGYFFTKREQAFSSHFNDERLLPLLQHGFIIRGEGAHALHKWPYYIPDHVWQELMANEDAYTVDELQLAYPLKIYS